MTRTIYTVFGTLLVLNVGAPASAAMLWLANDHLNTTILQTTTTGTVLQSIAAGNITGIAIDPVANELFLSSRTSAIGVRDLTTLAVTGSIPSGGSDANYEDLAWDGTSLYRGGFNSDRVYKIDRSTGAESIFVSDFNGVVGAAFDSSDNTLWVTSFQLGELRHYDSMGIQLGSAISLSGVLGSNRAGGLAYDPTDDTLWLGGDERVHHISKTGTSLGFFNTPEFGAAAGQRFVDGLEWQVPEPSSAVLYCLSLLAIAAGAARKGRRPAR